MSEKTTGGDQMYNVAYNWYCPKCGHYIAYGAYHYCQSINYPSIVISREAEILERLDKIIELLQQLARRA